MATLPASGALSVSAINAEFGRGNNLNAYRGTGWYTDAGASGTFSAGAIAFSEFHGKRLTAPFTLGFNNPFVDFYVSEFYSPVHISINSNGTISSTNPSFNGSTLWGVPVTDNIGTQYEASVFVDSVTSGDLFSFNSIEVSAPGTSPWYTLNTHRNIVLSGTMALAGFRLDIRKIGTTTIISSVGTLETA